MTMAEPTHTPPCPISTWATQQHAREAAHSAVETLLDYTTLPYSAPPAWRPDKALITVATVADLHRWQHELRALGVPGRITIDRPFHGMRTWVLHSHTPPGRDGYRAALQVTALAPADAEVPAELHEAA